MDGTLQAARYVQPLDLFNSLKPYPAIANHYNK